MCKVQICANQREEQENIEVAVTMDGYDDDDDYYN